MKKCTNKTNFCATLEKVNGGKFKGMRENKNDEQGSEK